MADIVHVSKDNFAQEVLNVDGPVLVDYWAEWCGPCKAVDPVLKEIAWEFGDRVKVAKLNVDENPELPARYGVRGIPTLMLFKNGEVQATKTGSATKAYLAQLVEQNA